MLTSLIADLAASRSFEDAATRVLQSALSLAEEALTESRFHKQGRLLRGVVHLRPDNAYQRLFGIEHPSNEAVSGPGYMTSATAWRYIAEHRCPVSIDVQLGLIHPGQPGHLLRDVNPLPFGSETRQRLVGRDATHVHVLPLRMPGGVVSGMISLEANCKAAMGKEFIWGECGEQLQPLADVAAPYLAMLSPRPAAIPQADPFLPVVGASSSSLVAILRIFAQQEETLLLAGPTGVGKSRLARFCHEQSRRKERRFEALDLLAVPEELQMAELFGWKRGAFTGAVKDNAGAIGRTAGGTLFIDEIDKLSLKAQAGLLQVLETRTYRPMGEESGEQRADVRFMVGTNADLLTSVRAGKFREDLYYRINVLPVRVPALSERLDELIGWARYMLERRHREGGEEGSPLLTQEAEELLLATPFPGNLRQLDNIIRRAYVLALLDQGGAGSNLALERRHVERALGYEGASNAPQESSLLHRLWRTAQEFAREAERRRKQGGTLSLELADSMRGLILAAALLRMGKREEVLSALDQELLIRNRNHHRTIKREVARSRELMTALGEELRELSEALDALESQKD
jgi:DNA-binding NtrC family response regulator